MIFNSKKILVFFAHPDDETLSVGGTIHKLTNNNRKVCVAIPSTGVHARKNIQNKKTRENKLARLKKHSLNAITGLGVKKNDIFYGNFSDNELDKHSLLELIHWLEKIIKKTKPDTILTHHKYCTNIDHQYCHNAAIVATRPKINSHINILCAETPGSTGYIKPTRWEPNYFVNLSKKNIEAKIKSIKKYKDEVRPDPHPTSPDMLRALAKVRGSESGFLYSEAFMVYKLYQN